MIGKRVREVRLATVDNGFYLRLVEKKIEDGKELTVHRAERVFAGEEGRQAAVAEATAWLAGISASDAPATQGRG